MRSSVVYSVGALVIAGLIALTAGSLWTLRAATSRLPDGLADPVDPGWPELDVPRVAKYASGLEPAVDTVIIEVTQKSVVVHYRRAVFAWRLVFAHAETSDELEPWWLEAWRLVRRAWRLPQALADLGLLESEHVVRVDEEPASAGVRQGVMDAVKRMKRTSKLLGIPYQPRIALAIAPDVPVQRVSMLVGLVQQAEVRHIEWLAHDGNGFVGLPMKTVALNGIPDEVPGVCAAPVVVATRQGSWLFVGASRSPDPVAESQALWTTTALLSSGERPGWSHTAAVQVWEREAARVPEACGGQAGPLVEDGSLLAVDDAALCRFGVVTYASTHDLAFADIFPILAELHGVRALETVWLGAPIDPPGEAWPCGLGAHYAARLDEVVDRASSRARGVVDLDEPIVEQ